MRPKRCTYQSWAKNRLKDRKPEVSLNNFLITVILFKSKPGTTDTQTTLKSLAEQKYRNIEVLIVGTDKFDGFDLAKSDNLRGVRTQPNATPLDFLGSDGFDDLWRGDYLMFAEAGTTFDHDFFTLVDETLCQNSSGPADIVVVDHDYTDPSLSIVEPVFLPGWDPDIIKCTDVVGLAFLASRKLIFGMRSGAAPRSIDGWIKSVADRQMQPATTHVTEPALHMVGSCPKILEWRPVAPLPWEAQCPDEWPNLAIVISNQNNTDTLKRCLGFLKHNNKFKPELIIVDNDSTDSETIDVYAQLADNFGARIVSAGPTLNYSRSVNLGVAAAKSDIVMLMHNNIDFAMPDQIEQLLLEAMRPEVGVVGTRLLCEDGSIHNAGISFSERNDGTLHIGRILKGGDPDNESPYYPINVVRNHQAVTGACQIVRREVFERLGGYDEVSFPIDYFDLDFCLRAHQAGLRVIQLPLSNVIHIETVGRSQKARIPPETVMKTGAMTVLKARWNQDTPGGNFYNPWIQLTDRADVGLPWDPKPMQKSIGLQESKIVTKNDPDSNENGNLRWALRHPRKAFFRVVGLPEKPKFSAPIPKQAINYDVRRLETGLGIYGYLLSEIGLGQAARNLVNAGDKAILPISALNIPLTNRQNDAEFLTKLDVVHDRCANMLVLDVLGANRAKDFLAPGRFNILYPYWELANIPSKCIEQIAPFDEIWAPTSFIASAMAKDFCGPVRLVPQPVKLPFSMPPTRKNRRKLRVFTFFDFDSFRARKNPEAAIAAFQVAFPQSYSDVELVVKARGKKDRGLRPWLHDVVARDKRIKFIDSTLSRDALDRLMADCDVFVSLHRAEGFGLGAAEALAAGKAVVSTDYGGTTDFISEDTGFPIPFEMQPVKERDYIQAHGQSWADASVDAAASALRLIYDSPDEAARRTMRGFDLLKTNHSPESVGAVMKKILTERGLT